MIKRWVIVAFMIFSLTACVQSQPSEMAVEVMAKRYWQDQLGLNEVLRLQDTQKLSGRLEGSGVYVAVVQYRFQTQLSESQMLDLLKASENNLNSEKFDRSEVVKVLQTLPTHFSQGQVMEVIKTLEFKDGSRGWLMSREIL